MDATQGAAGDITVRADVCLNSWYSKLVAFNLSFAEASSSS
jgi:hypothetical protein